MAKDSFLLYTEWGEQINKLSDEQAGLLIKSIFAYKNGKEVPRLDSMTEMCFSFLKSTIDRDAEKYDEICEKRREAGKKGGQANVSKCKQMQANANFAKHYDNDNEYEYEYEHDNSKTSTHGLIDTRARVREEDDDFEDDGWDPDRLITTTAGTQIRLGDVHFGKTVKIGIKRIESSSSQENSSEIPDNRQPITQEEKDRIMKRLEDFKKRQAQAGRG